MLNALLGVAIALSLASTAFASIEIHPAAVTVSRNDQAKITYIGKRDVFIVPEMPPPGFTVFVEKNYTSIAGEVNLFPENATDGRYQYLLAFYSKAPYTVTFQVLRYNTSVPLITESGIQAFKTAYRSVELINELTCPANVTTQLNVSLNVIQPKSGTPPPSIAMGALPNMPGWLVWVFAASLSVFLTTSLFSIRDLERARKSAWTFRQSAGAILIKHVLFGLIVAFFVSVIALLGAVLWGLLTGVTTMRGEVLVWTLVASGLPIVPVGVLYRLARWRGWYDEEG